MIDFLGFILYYLCMNILIMCNPYSGKGTSVKFAHELEKRIAKRSEHTTEIFLSQSIESLHEYFAKIKKEDEHRFDAAIFLGGDGTFGIAVDAMIKAGLDFPVAIFPLGTVNDFAKQLKMKKNVKRCVDVILSGKIRECDVANVNGDYVVNVACGGYFTHGANTYSRTAKKMFGKMAYYGKAVFNLFNMQGQRIRFVIDNNEVIEDEVVMYLILNSPSAGGFKKIGAEAKIDDGYFDLCAIKKARLGLLLRTAIKILGGRHIPDKYIIYRKGKHFRVELVEDKINPKFVKSDTDGNVGPELPLDIRVEEKKLKVYYKN